MRIGVLGGSFDPVHHAHLIIAQQALDVLGLETVVFVPAPDPPHKPRGALAPIEHRYRMVELALESDPRFVISDIERRRRGPSYTVDTLEELSRSLSPGDELFFLIGSDTVGELPAWHEAHRLPELSKLVILTRPGYPLERISSLDSIYSAETVERLRRGALTVEPIGISATAIRERCALGRSIRYLVPEAVRRYIEKHGLYQGPAEST